jgi:hypothetical protein
MFSVPLKTVHRTEKVGDIHTAFNLPLAETVSYRVLTEAARVPCQLKSRAICSGQSCTEAGVLRVLRFRLPLIHSSNCSTIITICLQGWYSRPINGNNGPGSTQASQIKENNKNIRLYKKLCRRKQELYKMLGIIIVSVWDKAKPDTESRRSLTCRV